MNIQQTTALALCLWLGACAKKEPAAVQAVETPPVRAELVQVRAQPFALTVDITGSLVSLSLVEVKAETVGKIVRISKREGDTVAAQEPVVWVDDSRPRLMARQAETAVQVAEASLERARVMEGHARSELERAKNLLQSGGITERDHKSAELTERDTRAQSNLAAAQLEQAKAQLAVARKTLADCVVPAPVAGEVQTRHVNEGAYVEAPTALFSIVDNTRLELESLVPTSDLAAIAPGQRVTFTVNAYPDREFEGKVIEVNPSVTAETRAAKVRIVADNGARKLKAGMFAQGRILTGMKSQAVLAPAAAVYREDHSAQTSYLFVVEGGKAVRRTVRIGRERDAELEIVEGLKAGETVVAAQSVEIAAGVRVEPLEKK